MKHLTLFSLLCLLLCTTVQAQISASLVDNPDWNSADDWSDTPPGNRTWTHVAFSHRAGIMSNLTVEDGGVLLISSSEFQTSNNITVKDGGTLIINGIVTGDDGQNLTIKSGGTLIVGAGGSIAWAGKFKADAGSTIRLDGLLATTAELSVKSAIVGTGGLITTGDPVDILGFGRDLIAGGRQGILATELDAGGIKYKGDPLSTTSFDGSEVAIRGGGNVDDIDHLSNRTSSTVNAGMSINLNNGGSVFMNGTIITGLIYTGGAGSEALANGSMPIITLFYDGDHDGYAGHIGMPLPAYMASTPFYYHYPSDCNDFEPLANPTLYYEPCDGIDNNCNGVIDENTPVVKYYLDLDDDGYGDDDNFVLSSPCNPVTYGNATRAGGDCDDDNDQLNPGMPDTNCDGIDNNCNGWVDEGCTDFTDNDGDGFAVAEDCDDNDPTVYLGAPEICGDNIDNDCDGQIDEYCISMANEILCESATNELDAGCGAESYQWDDVNNTTGATLSVTEAGAYNCLITFVDGTSITKTWVFTLSEISITLPEDIELCDDIPFSIDAGEGYASYLWSNGESTQEISDVQSGTYSVVVTNGDGCTATDEIDVVINDLPTVDLGPDLTICPGQTLVLDPTVSANIISYKWSDGSTTTTSEVTTAGTYYVGVTNTDGCQERDDIEITMSDLSVSVGVNYDVACKGGYSGQVEAAVIGGTGPFTYSWTGAGSAGDQGAIAYQVAAGTHTVVVTDANGCTATASADVSEPTYDVHVFSTNVVDATCNGASDGSVTIQLGGGTPKYNVMFDGGLGSVYSGTTAPFNQVSLSNLPSGTYTYTVYDSRSCNITGSFTIGEPASLVTTIANVGSPDCFGMSNGAINIHTIGGTQPYTYLWNDGTATQQFDYKPAGDYSVVVTDANGCTSTAAATIDQPDEFIATAVATEPTCGQTDGTIDLTLTGGNLNQWNNYSIYTWSNGAATEDLANLAGGTYTVQATDAMNLCTTSLEVIVPEFTCPPFVFVSETVVDATCNGATGTYTINVSGGLEPYSYDWGTLNGNTANNQVTGAAGSYTVVVTDALGSVVSQDFTITAPAELLVVASGNEADCDGNGSLTSSTTGGTAPYTYAWSNGGNTADVNGNVGDHTVVVTDANGCTASSQTTIAATTQGCVTLSSASCGETYTTTSSFVRVAGVAGATQYQVRWEWEEDTNNPPYSYSPMQTSDVFYLSDVLDVLAYNQTYKVSARAFINGSWTDYGPTCDITLGDPQMETIGCSLEFITTNDFIRTNNSAIAGQQIWMKLTGQTSGEVYYIGGTGGMGDLFRLYHSVAVDGVTEKPLAYNETYDIETAIFAPYWTGSEAIDQDLTNCVWYTTTCTMKLTEPDMGILGTYCTTNYNSSSNYLRSSHPGEPNQPIYIKLVGQTDLKEYFIPGTGSQMDLFRLYHCVDATGQDDVIPYNQTYNVSIGVEAPEVNNGVISTPSFPNLTWKDNGCTMVMGNPEMDLPAGDCTSSFETAGSYVRTAHSAEPNQAIFLRLVGNDNQETYYIPGTGAQFDIFRLYHAQDAAGNLKPLAYNQTYTVETGMETSVMVGNTEEVQTFPNLTWSDKGCTMNLSNPSIPMTGGSCAASFNSTNNYLRTAHSSVPNQAMYLKLTGRDNGKVYYIPGEGTWFDIYRLYEAQDANGNADPLAYGQIYDVEVGIEAPVVVNGSTVNQTFPNLAWSDKGCTLDLGEAQMPLNVGCDDTYTAIDAGQYFQTTHGAELQQMIAQLTWGTSVAYIYGTGTESTLFRFNEAVDAAGQPATLPTNATMNIAIGVEAPVIINGSEVAPTGVNVPFWSTGCTATMNLSSSFMIQPTDPNDSRQGATRGKMTGMNDLSTTSVEVNTYPNPATTSVTFEMSNLKSEPTTVRLMGPNGNMVRSKDILPIGSTHQASFTLENLAAGMYMVVISNGEETIQQPLIVE